VAQVMKQPESADRTYFLFANPYPYFMASERSTKQIKSEQCATELMETIHPIMQFIRTEMRSQREPSLSVPQFRLLAFLNRHPGISLSEVAEHLGVTRATASAMTDRLVQRRYVDRAVHPQERRQIMLKLTNNGQDLLEQMRDRTRRKIADLLDGLAIEQLAEVSAGLTLLGHIFQQTESDRNVS
jgi:DNA-binding MarR family transcriptional regulator